MSLTVRRAFSSTRNARHENPLGLPRRPAAPGPPQKRNIPNASKVLAVASGKGGVGKSTVAVNLAFTLAQQRLRVGILDLDIFGPSIPTLLGLTDYEEPLLTKEGAIKPLTNHGMPAMSMGFLLPKPSPETPHEEPAVVWRGLMVQKAVQQLLFDVDWRESGSGRGLDVLVLDMPPGTGDVPLTLGQLVNVDGAVIVSTPQDVALADVRKGISMMRKVSIPITGLVLNQSHFLCSGCSTPHYLYGSPDRFRETASRWDCKILGELPVSADVSSGGDKGIPFALTTPRDKEWDNTMNGIAKEVRAALNI